MDCYQCEDMLVDPSCEDPCVVTEMEPPAQQAAPFRVPVIVVVDDAGETQHHVAKECCVLHHVRICCRDGERRQRNKKKDDVTGRKESVMQEGQAREESGKGLREAERREKMSQTFFDLVVHGERVIGPHVGCNQDLSRVLQHLKERRKRTQQDFLFKDYTKSVIQLWFTQNCRLEEEK